jgi:hypothetical protein
MQLYPLIRVLRGLVPPHGVVLLASEKSIMLIGPTVDRFFCATCLRLRIRSSVSFLETSYTIPLEKKLTTMTRLFSERQCSACMFEIKDGHVFRHTILPVPGCDHKDA